MTGAIPNFQASVAGSPLHAARRKERVRQATQARTPRESDDSVELTEVELVDAVRETEDATSEETKEDHQQHAAGYNANGGKKPVTGPNIDLKG